MSLENCLNKDRNPSPQYGLSARPVINSACRIWRFGTVRKRNSHEGAMYVMLDIHMYRCLYRLSGSVNVGSSSTPPPKLETWVDVRHPSADSTETHWISESGVLEQYVLWTCPAPLEV
jgi:hypothetical protein